MGFVFDQMADGISLEWLTVVDALDQLKTERGLPKIIRTDNGISFVGEPFWNGLIRTA